MMRIFAIDPGPEKSAYVEYSAIGIESKGIWNNDDLINSLYERAWIESYVLEWIESFGMPVGQSIFKTVFWIGRFAEAMLCNNSEYHLVTRRQVKLNLCNSARAKDSNVRQALIDRLGPPGTKKNPGPTYGIKKDMWSALALAVTYCDLKEQSDEKRHAAIK